MKALILAAGRGKRLGNITKDTNKCLLEINGKSILEYNIDKVVDIENIKEIIIVVGHKAEDIINKYGISYKGKKIKYVFQQEQKGLVHAIEASKNVLGSDDFFLMLGDEVMKNSRHKELVDFFKKEDLFGVCGILEVKDKDKIRKTYTVITDENEKIYRLIEKPKVVLNNKQGTGHCVFKNEILSFIERTPIHPERGERELPDLIQTAIDNGKSVKVFNVCDAYTNINTEEDLEETNKIFLLK